MLSQFTRNRLILILVWLALYATFTLFLPPLLDDADSVHAEVAREMLLRHDWITLYANGIRYLEKAPILYWSMALSFRLFGVSTAAARLPIAFAVLGLCLLLESFARRAFLSVHAGLYAGLIFLSSFGIFIFTRITIPDVDVCLWLTFALYAFWTTEQPSSQRNATSRQTPAQSAALLPCLLFAAACALNILTKGLIGIVFPVAIVLGYLLLTRGPTGALQRLRQLHPAHGIVAFLVIAAPWHLLIGLANPTQGHPAPITFSYHQWQVPLPTDGNVHGWFWFYFVNEHLLRYLNLRVPRDYDTVPLALFWGLLLIWLMPWSAFLLNALARVPLLTALRRVPWRSHQTRHSMNDASRHKQATPLTSQQKTCLLLGLWALAPMLFFSLSTRQEYYVLPALPALILLIAAFLAEASIWNNDSEMSTPPTGGSIPVVETTIEAPQLLRVYRAGLAASRIASFLLAAGTVLAAAILVFLLHTARPTPETNLAALLHQNPADYALSFGHFLDLNARALGLFRTPLAITAVAFFLGPLAHWHLRRRARSHAAIITLAAATCLFLLAAHLGLQTFSPVLTSKELADAIAPQLHPEDLIVLHGEYESGSTLGFYLHRADLHILEGRSSNLWYGSFFPDAPQIFETRASITQKWLAPQRIFLWQDPSDPERPPLQLPRPTFLIARSGGKQILSNQPNRP